jgi:hypothetical protein
MERHSIKKLIMNNYVRLQIYPNGEQIPASLPPSYQLSTLGNTPAGQMCANCKYFQMPGRFCAKWNAPVKRRWWCQAWEKSPVEVVPFSKPAVKEVKPYKRISTSIVEEHFSSEPKPMYKNDGDVIRLDVPLLIRLLEYAREDAETDMDLHRATERMIELVKEGNVLNMDNYDDIVDTESND